MKNFLIYCNFSNFLLPITLTNFVCNNSPGPAPTCKIDILTAASSSHVRWTTERLKNTNKWLLKFLSNSYKVLALVVLLNDAICLHTLRGWVMPAGDRTNHINFLYVVPANFNFQLLVVECVFITSQGMWCRSGQHLFIFKEFNNVDRFLGDVNFISFWIILERNSKTIHS